MDISKIPEKAQQAIKRGVRRGDAVVRMESLDLPLRVINVLEDSEFHIIRLSDLLRRRPDEILSIPSMAITSLNQIYRALARYDELDAIEAENEQHGKLRTLNDEFADTDRDSLWEL